MGQENPNGRLRNYKVEVLEEAGHWIPVEEGEKLSRLLIEFIGGNCTSA